MSHTAHDLQQRLQYAEVDLQRSAGRGLHHLNACYSRIKALLAHIDASIQSGAHNGAEARALAKASKKLGATAKSYVKMQREADTLARQATQGFSSVIANPPSATIATHGAQAGLDGRGRAPYILTAYSWLLHNLNNPYPSNWVKRAIASVSGAPIKHIEGWFIDARDRIGWTNIRRQLFNNDRAATVEGAGFYFHTHTGYSPNAEYWSFYAMEKAARELYSHVWMVPEETDQEWERIKRWASWF